MKKQLLLLTALFFSFNVLSAQVEGGTWYETLSTDRALSFTIINENPLSGIYSSHPLGNPVTIDAPIANIIQKKDSLIISLGGTNILLSYRLKYDKKTNTYNGNEYFASRQIAAVSFGQKPVKRDLTIAPVPETTFTYQDTLRGSVTPERAWWDVTYYHLDLKVSPAEKYIVGSNTIQYKVLEPHTIMQIDLQRPLKIKAVIQNGKKLIVRRQGNAHFITMAEAQKTGKIYSLEVFYDGKPKVAIRAPWDGGFSWKKDSNGNDFVATSCQGLGASVWWPNKDHMYDEVDSMLISVTNPKGLTNVSNGRLRMLVENDDNTVTSHWFINNPINNYGVNINIGDYVHFSEVHQGENGPLDMDYYVLRDNLIVAKEHFKDAKKTIQAFEHWFGPYPFYEDGYKLVEVPYLGMEHQSSVTYGNQYMKGYLGRDLSGTGLGLMFDFIIIHESGHEWFANNITYKDIADMWVHEGFTNYSENLFLDYHNGKEASAAYVIGTRKGIRNDKPIIGKYGVNNRGSGDMYAKGGNLLHTLRQVINDDEKWRQILRGLNKEFYHQTVTTAQIENYISQEAEMVLKPFFDQYLRTINIPTLEYHFDEEQLVYRWINCLNDFDMPIKVFIDNKPVWIHPQTEWTHQHIKGIKNNLIVDPNFYVGQLKHLSDPTSNGKE